MAKGHNRQAFYASSCPQSGRLIRASEPQALSARVALASSGIPQSLN